MNSYVRIIGNLGAELGRARSRRALGDNESALKSIERCLSMCDELTLEFLDKPALREILRLRDGIAQNYLLQEEPYITIPQLEEFCLQFSLRP